MTTRTFRALMPIGQASAQIFLLTDHVNQLIIEHLAPAAWKANPPGRVRSIAAIFSHLHNVRCKWVRLTAPHLKIPAKINRADCTQREACAALAESATCCTEMLEEALSGDGRINKFRRDGWAGPWPVGPEMLYYMVSHEAHHRGQVCMLAHQLGFRLPNKVTSEMWNWEKLWE